MKNAFRSLALAVLLLPDIAWAQAPQFPQTLCANCVWGRLGIGPGPTQAIPFATLGIPIIGNAFVRFAGPAVTPKTYTLANVSDTIALLGQIQTWTGAQSYTDGTLILLGATSGSSTLKAPATGGGTATLFPGSDTIVGLAATQTLTGKTLTSPTLTSPAINGGTGSLGGLTALGIRDTSAAFDVLMAATSSPALTAQRTITWDVENASPTIHLAGSMSFGNSNFVASGNFAVTHNYTGATTVTFPTAGTLSTVAGTETPTNKTFDTAATGNVFKINGTQITANTGTGNNVLATTPTINQANLVGTTTNDNAAAGSVGEYIQSVVVAGSAVTLSSAVVANITSISLPAGDWDVNAIAVINPNSTTSNTFTSASLSLASAALDTTPGRLVSHSFSAVVSGGQALTETIAPYRFSLASTTTIFLVTQDAFTVSTCGAFGILRARRVR